jgi:VWFA-related protein
MLSSEETRMGALRRRSLAIVAATLGMVFVVAAQEPQKPPAKPPQQEQPPPQPAGDPPQPVFRTGINFVRVDAIVTDRQGNPVSDLKQTDFEVFEDNKPQGVETFRLVKIDAVAPAYTQRSIRSRDDEETAAADENARIFVFFLDDYHVRLGTSMVVRRPLVEFIANQLSPNDLIAVMYPLTPVDAVVLTRNHQGVINTVEKFVGRKFDYEPKNDIEAAYVYKYPSNVVETIRRQVSMSALRGISQKLGSLREGRKSIILVSEGYTALLPPQMRNAIAGMPGMVDNPARRDPFAGDNNMLEDRARFSADVDMLQELQDVFDAANRNNTSIYAVDPRGLSAGEFDISENISMTTSQSYLNSSMDTLRTMAENTDGRAIVNRNDLAAGMKQIIRDSSAYYLLGYNSTLAPQDGKFHEIKVRVKRSGVQVRARKGYWAMSAADVERAKAPAKSGPPPAVSKALAAMPPVGGRRLTRDWIGTSRGADGLTKVTFLWEPNAAAPGVKRDEARRVSLLVTSSAGDIVYRGRVPNDLAAPGTGASVSFDAKPGKLEFKITVEGDGTGTLDTENRAVTVPDLDAPEVRVTTPRVWFGRTAREFQALVTDPNAKPTAARDFRRTDRLLLRFEAIAPASSPVSVTARMLNQQGVKIADIPTQAPAAPGEPYAIDLPLSNIAPGQYLLEISAAAEGHQPVSELVAFRIGG